jgi:hypothetical protein
VVGAGADEAMEWSRRGHLGIVPLTQEEVAEVMGMTLQQVYDATASLRRAN